MPDRPDTSDTPRPGKLKIVVFTVLGALGGMLLALVGIAIRAVVRDFLSARSLEWVLDVTDGLVLAAGVYGYLVIRRRAGAAEGGRGEDEQHHPLQH